MNVLWTIGEGTVQDVCDNLTRELAYTTVMTTLNLLAIWRARERRSAAPSPDAASDAARADPS